MPGRIYVAPPGCHMLLEPGRVRLTNGPKENGVRPAIDPLFRSAAHTYGSRVVGVILSGNLADGSAGLFAVKQCGGIAVVQDPDTAVYDSMPRHAIDTATADHILPVGALPALLTRLARQPAEERPMTTDESSADDPEVESEAEDAALLDDRHEQPGIPSTMTCPECHGTLWEVRDGELLLFRCRVGHAFSADALAAEQAEALEAALWTALRALEEHAALNRRLAARAQDRNHAHSAAMFTEHAVDAEHHASIVRNVLERGAISPPTRVAAGPE